MEKQIEEMAKDFCISLEDAKYMYEVEGYRKVVMCKDCAYCEEHHYEVEGERPYVKLACKWNSYSHDPNDYCGVGKMKGE